MNAMLRTALVLRSRALRRVSRFWLGGRLAPIASPQTQTPDRGDRRV